MIASSGGHRPMRLSIKTGLFSEVRDQEGTRKLIPRQQTLFDDAGDRCRRRATHSLHGLPSALFIPWQHFANKCHRRIPSPIRICEPIRRRAHGNAWTAPGQDRALRSRKRYRRCSTYYCSRDIGRLHGRGRRPKANSHRDSTCGWFSSPRAPSFVWRRA